MMKKNIFSVSARVRTFKKEGDIFLYHAIHGNLCKVDSSLLILLENKTLCENKFSVQDKKVIRELHRYGFLLKNGEDEYSMVRKKAIRFLNNADSGKLITSLRLNISEACNCACTYCFVRKTNDKNLQTALMPWDIASTAITNFFKLLHKSNNRRAIIRFFGGEPLLNTEILFKSLILADKLSKKYNIYTKYLVNTNGTIASRSVSQMLRKFKINLVVSLDGLMNINDRCRMLKNGLGTFDLVNKNIKIFQKDKNKIYISTVITDRKSASNLNKFIDFLAVNNLKFLGVNYEQCYDSCKRDLVIDSEVIDLVLKARKYADKKGVELRGFWDILLGRIIKGDLGYCGGIGKELSVNWDGDIFPCAGTKIKIGHVDHIESIFNGKEYQGVTRRIVGNINGCMGCEIEGMCCGGCAAESLYVCGDFYKKAPGCNTKKIIMKKLIKNFI